MVTCATTVTYERCPTHESYHTIQDMAHEGRRETTRRYLCYLEPLEAPQRRILRSRRGSASVFPAARKAPASRVCGFGYTARRHIHGGVGWGSNTPAPRRGPGKNHDGLLCITAPLFAAKQAGRGMRHQFLPPAQACGSARRVRQTCQRQHSWARQNGLISCAHHEQLSTEENGDRTVHLWALPPPQPSSRRGSTSIRAENGYETLLCLGFNFGLRSYTGFLSTKKYKSFNDGSRHP